MSTTSITFGFVGGNCIPGITYGFFYWIVGN